MQKPLPPPNRAPVVFRLHKAESLPTPPPSWIKAVSLASKVSDLARDILKGSQKGKWKICHSLFKNETDYLQKINQ